MAKELENKAIVNENGDIENVIVCDDDFKLDEKLFPNKELVDLAGVSVGPGDKYRNRTFERVKRLEENKSEL